MSILVGSRNFRKLSRPVRLPEKIGAVILLIAVSAFLLAEASSSPSAPPKSSSFLRSIQHRTFLHQTQQRQPQPQPQPQPQQQHRLLQQLLLEVRGGESSSSSKGSTKKKKKKNDTTSKKKKKKSSTSGSAEVVEEPKEGAKDVIENAMKKDSAEALGDAIRDRAEMLRQEDPLLQGIDWSLSSLGHAVGASDVRMMMMMNATTHEDSDGGGIEAAPTSIIANYFLKSHGGAHAVQCACSILATLSGLGVVLFNKYNKMLCATLIRRTLLFAMIKHVSGLLAAASLAAKSIPEIGLSQARVWMEQLAHDPVSQYVFYTSVMLFWLPSSRQAMTSSWWFKNVLIPAILIGPVLLREVISSLLVASDVLVLWSYGGGSDENDEASEIIRTTILPMAQATIDAFMSVLVSASVWRSADPAKRQEILAKSISKLSLILEVFTGLVLAANTGLVSTQFLFGAGEKMPRPSLKELIKHILCVRLYSHFLWVRRKKIAKLAVNLRGGAAQLPFWVLDVILDPSGSMGLRQQGAPGANGMSNSGNSMNSSSAPTWKDYFLAAVGMDE